MIVRNLMLRQGRQFLSSSKPQRPVVRTFASTVDTIQQSLDSSLKKTHSIESQLQDISTESITTIDSVFDAAAEDAGYHSSHAHTLPTREGRTTVEVQHSSFKHAQRTTSQLGSQMTPHFEHNQYIFNPPKPSQITLEMLLGAGAHLGHATALWNPMNSRWIYGIRQGIHVISLDATAAHLRRACRVVEGVTERAGLVLFVGTRPGQETAVVEAAKNAQGCHLFDKWKPGSITNGDKILRGCGVQAVDHYDREIPGYELELLEMPVIKPDLVVCLNPMQNWVLLHECALHQIPTIGIIDTNADSTWVTYPIPGNDDSIRTAQIVAGALGMAGKEGQQRRKMNAFRGGDAPYKGLDLEAMRKQDEMRK